MRAFSGARCHLPPDGSASPTPTMWVRASVPLFRSDRKRHPIDEENGVDIGTTLILVGGSDMIAVLRDEVVVIGYEQKIVPRIGAIERRHDCHAFPLFRQIVAVVGLTVAQSEFVQLSVVIDVDEARKRRGHDAVLDLALWRDRGQAIVSRPRAVGWFRS